MNQNLSLSASIDVGPKFRWFQPPLGRQKTQHFTGEFLPERFTR
jgi:hypothetical protein